jgi:hypothetical protein
MVHSSQILKRATSSARVRAPREPELVWPGIKALQDKAHVLNPDAVPFRVHGDCPPDHRSDVRRIDQLEADGPAFAVVSTAFAKSNGLRLQLVVAALEPFASP